MHRIGNPLNHFHRNRMACNPPSKIRIDMQHIYHTEVYKKIIRKKIKIYLQKTRINRINLNNFIPSNAWLAITLSTESFTRCINTSNWVTITAFTSIARLDVEVSVLAFVTIASNHIRFAFAFASQLVTNRYSVGGLFCSRWVA